MLTAHDINWLFYELHKRNTDMREGANERDYWGAVLSDRGLTISDVQRKLRYLDSKDIDCPCTPEAFAKL